MKLDSVKRTQVPVCFQTVQNTYELICVPLTRGARCCCVLRAPSEEEEDLGGSENILVLQVCGACGYSEH